MLCIGRIVGLLLPQTCTGDSDGDVGAPGLPLVALASYGSVAFTMTGPFLPSLLVLPGLPIQAM